MSPHTMKHMRSEYFQTNGVTDQKSREKWEKDGALDARERARQLARKILAQPPAEYIPEAVDRQIRERFEILL
jgi:trimethylamine--corrinoid protein Co-methyltransferase